MCSFAWWRFSRFTDEFSEFIFCHLICWNEDGGNRTRWCIGVEYRLTKLMWLTCFYICFTLYQIFEKFCVFPVAHALSLILCKNRPIISLYWFNLAAGHFCIMGSEYVLLSVLLRQKKLTVLDITGFFFRMAPRPVTWVRMRKKNPVISNTGKFFCFNNNVSNLYNNSVVEKIYGMAYIFTLLMFRKPNKKTINKNKTTNFYRSTSFRFSFIFRYFKVFQVKRIVYI